MRKNGFKKDLLALPPRSGSCNFSFLKNALERINSKLNEKNRMITYTNSAPNVSNFTLLL